MLSNLLNELILSVQEQNLNVLHVIVRQDGEIIARHDFHPEQPRLLYSASKTFTSMASGIAINQGYFKLNDKVIDFFPEYSTENPYLQKLTLHHLLSMSVGHRECPVMKADWHQPLDIAQLFFDEPLVYEPGTHFTYDNSCTHMVSRIISLTTGQNLNDYLNDHLFKALAIPKPQWDTCPKGFPQGFSGLHLTATQLSKFGQLLLNQGNWQGQQLIPSDYIQQATSVQVKTADYTPDFATADHHQGYGYQIWRNAYPNSYRLDGLYGQYVVILPDKNAVVTYVSNEPQKMTSILELTWKTLVQYL